MKESHEDDLSRAIKASLELSHREDDQASESDDDLRAAIALSLAAQPKEQESGTKQGEEGGEQTQPSTFVSERAKMEQERLARLKRLRPDLSSPTSSSGSNAKRPRVASAASSSSSDSDHTPPRASQARKSASGDLFWDGALRQTAVRPADPRQDGQSTFRLTQILGNKDDIAFAILSTYSLDLPWIYQLFNPSTPVILVMPPNPEGAAKLHYALPNWMRTSPLLRGGRGAMHVKLFYKCGRLRVVILTANLMDYDFRDIENTVWLQDIRKASGSLPARTDTKSSNPSPLEEDFQTGMARVLKALNVAPALSLMRKEHPDIPLTTVDDLKSQWDWSRVTALLVPCMSGKYEGWPTVVKNGHPRLMAAIRCLDLSAGRGKGKGKGSGRRLELDCQGSSIGQYSTQWMNEFYHSACGKSAEEWLDEPKSRRAKLSYPPVKIVFPSLKTVQQSALGEGGGGTMFCRQLFFPLKDYLVLSMLEGRREQWSAKNFPRDHFYDSKSKAGPVLMHSKMIIATLTSSAPVTLDLTNSDEEVEVKAEDEFLGWAYIGSSNFTPSAWGTLSGSSFNPVLNVVNYELGLVLPLKSKEEADLIACFRRPPPKYRTADLPWMQAESTILAHS